MKIGMSLLPELETLEQHIEFAKENKVDFIELNSHYLFSVPDRIDWKMLNASGIDFTVHMPEDLNIAKMYEPRRKSNVDYAIHLMKAFNTNGNITKFNFHVEPGTISTTPRGKLFLSELYINDYMKSFKKSLKELSEFAVRNNVTICFENVAGTKPYLLDAFREVIKTPNVYLTLDIGHNARDNNLIEPLMMQYPEKIKHLHMHDFDGKLDHQELGTGNIDFKKYISFAKKNDLTVTIEVRGMKELQNSLQKIYT